MSIHPATLELFDRPVIFDLVVRHAREVRRSDEPLVRPAYHQEAAEEHGFNRGDLEGLIGYLRAATQGPAQCGASVEHLVTDLLFDVREGILAFVRSNAGGRLSISGVARCVDHHYERCNGEWRTGHRRVVPEWFPPEASIDQIGERFRDPRNPPCHRTSEPARRHQPRTGP